MSDGLNAPHSSADGGGDAASAQEAMASAAGQAQDKMRELADRQKSAGADQIEGVAGAVHRAADELGGQMPQAAGYVHEAAAGLERVSSSLRSSSVGDIVGTLEDFARRQPAAYFGATVLAGFALSRFLKSSAPTGRPAAGRSDGAANR